MGKLCKKNFRCVYECHRKTLKLLITMNKIFSLFLIILLSPLLLLVSMIVILSSGLPVVHWSKRVGRKNQIFFMPKFRTMKNNTPQKATHLLKNNENYTTKFGYFLRKTSLDELPQLFCILNGKMNFIGPRPALFNQNDLIKLRTLHSIHMQKPGITGLAQVNGRDSLSVEQKVEEEKYYLKNKSFKLNIYILLFTIFKIFKSDDISH